MRDDEKIPPQIPVTPEMRAENLGAMAEIDPAQIAILARMTVAERVAIGFSLSNSVRKAGAHRLRQLDPTLDEAEASRRVLAIHYAREQKFNERR